MEPKPGRISLVIPIYNEAQHLEAFLKKVDALKLPVEKELVFVDDASTDASLKVLKSHTFVSQHQIHEVAVNCGKGHAIRIGIQHARGDLIVIQDADFEYEPEDLSAMIEIFLNGAADVVLGSRFKKTSSQVHRTFHYLVNRLLTTLSNLASGLYLSDMETCYKMFKSEILKNIYLESNRFGFEPEVTAKIARLRARVHEVPVRYFPRNYLEGKKITWRDGLAALWQIAYYNWLADQRRFFKASLPDQYKIQGRQWL